MNKKSQTPEERKLFVKRIGIFSLILIFAIGMSTLLAGFSVNLTTKKKSSEKESEQPKKLSPSDRKLAATAYREQMLEADRMLRKKHKRNKRSNSDTSKDSSSARKKWNNERDATERAISKFKNDKNNDKRSVSYQLKKNLKRLESDAPGR